MSTRSFLVLSGAVLAASAILFFFWWNSTGFILYCNVIQIIVLALGAYTMTGVASTHASRKLPWRNWARLAGGMWMWVLGQCLEALAEVMLNITPYGTVADGFWMIGYFLLLSGLGGLILERRNSAALHGVGVSSAIVMCAAALMAAWVAPHFANPGRDRLLNLLDVAYPLCNLAVLFCAMILFLNWRVEDPASGRAWLVLMICFIVETFLDTAWSYLSESYSFLYRLQDFAYFVGYSLFTLCALLHRDRLAAR